MLQHAQKTYTDAHMNVLTILCTEGRKVERGEGGSSPVSAECSQLVWLRPLSGLQGTIQRVWCRTTMARACRLHEPASGWRLEENMQVPQRARYGRQTPDQGKMHVPLIA